MKIVSSRTYQKKTTYQEANYILEGISEISSRMPFLHRVGSGTGLSIHRSVQPPAEHWMKEREGVVFVEDSEGILYTGIAKMNAPQGKNFDIHGVAEEVLVEINFFLGEKQPKDSLERKLLEAGFR